VFSDIGLYILTQETSWATSIIILIAIVFIKPNVLSETPRLYIKYVARRHKIFDKAMRIITKMFKRILIHIMTSEEMSVASLVKFIMFVMDASLNIYNVDSA
jgi:hypothetical protein